MRDIQVLCPMNRGGLGARSLNIELQRALNPRGDPKVEKFGTTFAIGDKVMQIENDYDKEVYNGDIGYVEAIDLELGEMTIAFDGRPVAYAFGELDQIVLAYATTIHKSQGSEISRCRHSHHDTALYDAATQSALHRGHPRQAAHHPARAEESGGDRRQERLGPAALVEAARMAESR
jgi:ATP-dependent RecD-like DNA helicase SH3 domain